MGNYWLELDEKEEMFHTFFVELANMVYDRVERMLDECAGPDHVCEPFDATKLYEKYPEVRVCLRRALIGAEKKGYISKYYANKIMCRKE